MACFLCAFFGVERPLIPAHQQVFQIPIHSILSAAEHTKAACKPNLKVYRPLVSCLIKSLAYLRITRLAKVIKPMMKPARPKTLAMVSQLSKGKANGASEWPDVTEAPSFRRLSSLRQTKCHGVRLVLRPLCHGFFSCGCVPTKTKSCL